MEKYVKFRQGLITEFEKLTVIEPDTLYFVYDASGTTAELYLGSRKVLGGNANGNPVSLGDIDDVTLKDLQNSDILAYNSLKNEWVNISLETIIDELNRPTVIVLTGDNENDHQSLIDQEFNDIDPKSGDIVIIKDLIKDNTYLHSGYIFNGSEWTALNGNYAADKIYFNNNFIFTEDIGTVKVPADTGNIEINATGKNLKEFLSELFAKEQDPTVVKPSATLNLSTPSSKEVGTKYKPSYSIDFREGSYSYGPDTGVTATYHVSDGTNTFTDISNKFPETTIKDNYTITATINYSDGAIPFTNLGNQCSNDIGIKADQLILSKTISGYRKSFYGALDHKEDYLIRDLNSSGSALKNGSTFTIDLTENTQRVVIAYPASLQNLSSVLDQNDSNSNIVSGFGNYVIQQVPGANNYDAIDYKVYTMNFARPYGTTNKFTVTI